jgi:nitrate/nitrite-specific signal transduction histidine kinase
MQMGFLDQIQQLRWRLRHTWKAWKAPMPRLRRGNSLDDDNKAEVKRQLTDSIEELQEDLKDEIWEDLTDQVEEQTEALDEANRGGNGNGDD